MEIEKRTPIEDSETEQEVTKLERLISELQKTNHLLEKTFDWKRVIGRGVVTGLFTVIGATVLAGILFSMINLVFGDVPFIR